MVTEFQGKYRFLSNFWPSPVMLDGVTYPSVEHAFQAAKTYDERERLQIQMSSSPGDAKRLGRQVKLRKDWEQQKINVMLDLVRQKFRETILRDKLAATEGELIEGNYWGDTFWGVCKGKGQNHLGKILMQVRDEIAQLDTTSENVPYAGE